jgi:hypothetical protein
MKSQPDRNDKRKMEQKMEENNTNLPAKLSDSVDFILKETARSNPLARFKKGKFFIGEDEVPVGREYNAYPLDWVRGWVKWENGAVIAEHLGRVADGFVPAERPELGDTDKLKWEEGNDSWQLQNMLPLEDAETGEFLVFVSGSFGGKLAIEKLCNRVARDLKAGRDRGLPRIKLAVAEFNTKNFGEVQRPDFVIVGWERDDRVPSPSDLPPGDIPPGAKGLSDTIPF